VNAANPGALARTFARDRELAFLFRTLATLRRDVRLFDTVDELQWTGPSQAFPPLAARLEAAVTTTTRPPL
jgi:hypothetical protein